jgi:signal transduction histidine kinase
MADRRLVVALQALMLLTFLVFESGVILHFAGRAPRAHLLASSVLVAIYGLYGGVRMVRLATGRGDPDRILRGALLLDDSSIWIATAAIVGLLWLLFPYGDTSVLYAYIIACVTAMSGFALSSIRRPPTARGAWPALAALPAALTLYLLVHADRLSLLIALAVAANGAGLLAGRHFVEKLMLNAWRARRDTETALAELAAGRDARSRFLAAASHDLGQPLQAARLFFDQTLDARDAAARDRAARKVERAFDVMDDLMRHMLDHLRLEASLVRPRTGPLVLGPLIARVAETHEDAARASGVALSAMPSSRSALGDPGLVERCLGNFVVNALRHAKAKRVVVGVRAHAMTLRVWVVDDGRGISQPERERLFDDFVQGRESGGSGFGLGLSSARRIAALMDGSVGYCPGPCGGSAFWLELPRA